jgi:O-methyltransferase
VNPRQLAVRLLQATRLNRLAHRLYYNHFHGFDSASHSTVEAIQKTFDLAQQRGSLDGGDYFEFGLFKGYSFWSAQQKANACGAGSMNFFGFDSFEGLPEVTGPDKTERDHFYKGQYRCSYDTVRASLENAGVDWNRTTLIRGYFDESLKDELHREHGMRPLSIALIDCDLYSSTVDVLRFIDPLIQDQSILIFDDWNCFDKDDEKGQRKAFAELLERRVDLRAEPLFEYGTWGQVFLIHQP